MSTFQPGDRVKFSVHWLRSTGQYTGPVPFARGTIVEETERGVATVNWDNLEGMERVLSSNLVPEKKVQL